LVYYGTLESNSYKGEENVLDEESCSAMNVNAGTLIYEYQRPSCMSIGTRSSLMKDHKGMVGIDATSKDAYIPGQSGRVLFAALVSSQVYCKEEQGFQIAKGCEGVGLETPSK
ncbi:hypothetical protein MTR67_052177, partial [Solanum verrucosum]